MYRNRFTILLIALVNMQIAFSTVFLEQSKKPAINLSEVCIGYLTLEDTIAESKKFKKRLEYLISHPMIQGIVLAIDSGGGIATAGWDIFEALKRANIQKPIISYIDEMCASAAYLAATGTSKILASPMATIGSIGVARTIEKLRPTEFKRDGLKGAVTIHHFKKGKFKQLGNPWDDMTDDDLTQIEESLNFSYKTFCVTVATQRRIPLEQVQALESLTFPGIKAFDLGLIDKTGSFDDALELLKEELITRGVSLPTGLNLKESMLLPE